MNSKYGVEKVIICGFDYDGTQKRAKMLADRFGMKYCNLLYVTDKSYREDDMICHMDGGGEEHVPEFRYIRLKEADAIYARTDTDACRHFDYLRPEGVIAVETDGNSGLNSQYSEDKAKRYLEIQAETGYVRRFIHCKYKTADV